MEGLIERMLAFYIRRVKAMTSIDAGAQCPMGGQREPPRLPRSYPSPAARGRRLPPSPTPPRSPPDHLACRLSPAARHSPAAVALFVATLGGRSAENFSNSMFLFEFENEKCRISEREFRHRFGRGSLTTRAAKNYLGIFGLATESFRACYLKSPLLYQLS